LININITKLEINPELKYLLLLNNKIKILLMTSLFISFKE